jgi:hypothetical protein
MNSGMQAGLAMAAGYLLGRTRKLKLALTVGGLVAGRRLGSGGDLLKQAVTGLQSSPQAQRLKGEVRQQLFDAGKTAAVTAASGTLGRLASRVRPSDDSAGASSSDEGGESEEREESPRRSPSRKAAARTSTPRKSPPRKSAPRKSAPRKSTGRSAQGTRGGRNG